MKGIDIVRRGNNAFASLFGIAGALDAVVPEWAPRAIVLLLITLAMLLAGKRI